MTAGLDFHGEVLLSRGKHDIVVRGRGSELEVEVPGILWALRELRNCWSSVSGVARQVAAPFQQTADFHVTVRTRRRRWMTIIPRSRPTLLGRLGLPNGRIVLFG